ncbi:MAG: hypothetical protein HY860_03125, partial [Chlamydiales bacterium]|nr:hypothetical protein [Chlamydiales bacterium]
MQILALNKKNTQIALVIISKEKNDYKVDCLKTIDIQDDINEQIELFSSKGKIEIASSLPSKQVFLRNITLSLKRKREVKKVLPFQIESLLPGDYSEMQMQFNIKVKNKLSKITLLCCKKESLQQYIEDFHQYNIDIDWVGAHPWSIYRFATFACENIENAIILYVGEVESFFVCI